MRGACAILLNFLAIMVAPAASAATIDFGSLLGEMTDLERLAEFPDPPYVTRQAASHNHVSGDGEVPTRDDGLPQHGHGRFLREERRGDVPEYVMLDTAGPGAIVRIWSDNPDPGCIVRIYLDQGERPSVEMPLPDMLGGDKEPFLAPIAGVRAQGWNSYLPIPYGEHCKVTVSQQDLDYQINYRTYPAGVEVETFSLHEAKDSRRKIQATLTHLDAPSANASRVAGRGSALQTSGENEVVSASSRGHVELSYAVPVAPGEIRQVERLTGAGAIYVFSARIVPEEGMSTADPTYEQSLREMAVEAVFDGTGVPQVFAPLGDFFGAMPGVRPYDSLPITVAADGTMTARWVMPFQREAVVRLHNRGNSVIRIQGRLAAAPREWTSNTLFFHAGWHAGREIPTRPRQDWNFLHATGTGRFVGVAYTMANPVPSWWGEGGERITLDGELISSTRGTGTAGYFGYAQGGTALFSHAYHNQIRVDGPSHHGHTTLNRFQIMDDMPFRTTFRFDMEIGHREDTTISQAVTAFWYAAPGGESQFPPMSVETVPVPALEEAKIVEGVLEGELLHVLEHASGKIEVQSSKDRDWSGWAQLCWSDGKPGDELVAAFEAPDAGKYKVFARFTAGKEYGLHRLVVNTTPVDMPIDFYQPEAAVLPERLLGTYDLTAGENTLLVLCAGSNPKADPKQYAFGLDYLRLEKLY
jgi:hypothetical protein